MTYSPKPETAKLLDRALAHVQDVEYDVTARWVFYRLLQDGYLSTKADYKRLLSYLSKARKQRYGGWRPWTLADDTRTATVRGEGYRDGEGWIEAVGRMECELDKWPTQANYVEVWFEASAMESQFKHYTHEFITLLSFHGDVSIPAKWKAAQRLYGRMKAMRGPQRAVVLYYGDLDAKGLEIPESARRDVRQFIAELYYGDHPEAPVKDVVRWLGDRFTFERVGLNREHIAQYDIPENPERPDAYQWEGVPDDAAEALIGQANGYIDLDAADVIAARQDDVTEQFRTHLDSLELTGEAGGA